MKYRGAKIEDFEIRKIYHKCSGWNLLTEIKRLNKNRFTCEYCEKVWYEKWGKGQPNSWPGWLIAQLGTKVFEDYFVCVETKIVNKLIEVTEGKLRYTKLIEIEVKADG